MGLALASALVADGAKVHAWDRVEVPHDAGDWTEVDLAEAESIARAAAGITDPVTCIAHCAGLLLSTHVDAENAGELIQVGVQVHAIAFLRLVQALRPRLRLGHGSAVAISSVADHLVYPGSLAYGPSKAALSRLVAQLSTELGPEGVRVNAIAPASIQTPMSAHLWSNPEIDARWVRWVPLGRRGTADEVTSVIRFLASASASYISGVVLPVDGGLSAGLAHMIGT
jgi:NAD(P)-dependent dehydrogenase (short-subunit alcohol dehydrogenase family)